jgi:imidazolonepropionase-like amidohydrolase
MSAVVGFGRTKHVAPVLFSATCLIAVVAGGTPVAGQTPATTVFEGARLVNGDASVIENAAFAIEGSRVVAVGRRGEVQAPAAAARVDLTGKTVIPALIDAHSHIGYMHRLSSGPQNYTRENILDHMHKFAYFGVAASMAMGSDFGDLPFRLRDETRAGKHPHAARFLTAGRGLAPIDEIKPNNMRHSAHLVTTEDDARNAVAELAANGVEMVKTWVDTRGGTIRKLTPPLYEAIIDEAHKRKMRVVVHATGLVDVKALTRAGMDGFAHMVGDVDDELMDLLKAKPDTFFLLALGGLRRQMHAPWIDPPHALVSDSLAGPDQAVAGPIGEAGSLC